MRIEKERRIGIVLTYLQTAVSLILGIVYTPFLLKLLGQSEYGLYQLSASLVSNLGLLSLGFNGAYTRFYIRGEKENETSANKVNGLFLIIYGVIALLTLIVGWVIVVNSDFLLGNKLALNEKIEAKYILMILTLSTAIDFAGITIYSYINVKQKYIFLNIIRLIVTVATPLATLGLCFLGFKAMSIAITGLILNIFVNSFYLLYAKRKIGFKVVFEIKELHLLKEIIPFTFFVFLSTMVGLINDSIDKYIIGVFWGAKFVTIYSMGFLFKTYYNTFASAISNTYTPLVHSLIIKNKDMNSVNKLFVKIGRQQYIILQLCLAGFIIYGRDCLYLWLGDGYTDSYYVAIAILVPSTIPIIQKIAIEIQRAQYKHQFRSLITTIMALLNLGFTILFCPKYGIVSCSVVTGISYFICNGIILNVYYQKKLGLDVGTFWKAIAHVLLAIPLPIIISMGLKVIVNPGAKWTNWIAQVAIFIIVYGISIYYIELSSDERERIISKIKQIFTKERIKR